MKDLEKIYGEIFFEKSKKMHFWKFEDMIKNIKNLDIFWKKIFPINFKIILKLYTQSYGIKDLKIMNKKLFYYLKKLFPL